MQVFNAQQTFNALPWAALIDALREGFKHGCDAPIRHHHGFDIVGEQAGSLLLMPAWVENSYVGVKQVIVIPDNARRGLPAVNANYQLSCASSGQLLASIDGEILTQRRTAAASALASTYLSRPDSRHLLMVGSGAMARSLIPAHCAVRPIRQVSIWSRNIEHSRQLAAELSDADLEVSIVDDVTAVAAEADIITCATMSQSPLLLAESVRSGTHVDLVGAFTADMCECDSDLIAAARVFVDTRAGVLAEGGDIIQAIREGKFSAEQICASLRQLCRREALGRKSGEEITLFKSVGTALEDLYAAILVHQSQQ